MTKGNSRDTTERQSNPNKSTDAPLHTRLPMSTLPAPHMGTHLKHML